MNRDKEKRIPTIIGIILLTVATFAGLYLTGKKTFFSSKASGDCNPQNVQVSNISHYSFNVSFTTSANCLSNLVSDNRTLADIRFTNLNIQPTAGKIHYFEINNLKENTEYPYYFIIDGKKYSGTSYKITTAKKPAKTIPVSQLAWGKVYTPDLKPASNAIVFLAIPGGSLLSSFVTAKGYWNISLATSFNESLTNWLTPKENINEEITVIADDGTTTQITGNTSRNNPVPDIILGQTTFASVPVDSTGKVINDTKTQSIEKSLSIINPKEGESINTQKPDIFGQGPVSTALTIQVTDQTFSVTTQNDGSWHWSPTFDLPIGANTITVKTLTSQVSRSFIIAPNTGLAFSASESASLSPTLIPTTNTPSPTISPTIKPTSTPSPTITSTQTRTSKPSTSSGVPVTGNSLPTTAISLFSVVTMILSLIIFKTKI